MNYGSTRILILSSPPSRRRGLKYEMPDGKYGISSSPPSRRRGLKLILQEKLQHGLGVASFAEAWIKIMHCDVVMDIENVASFAEAWIEIVLNHCKKSPNKCRLLRGGVD